MVSLTQDGNHGELTNQLASCRLYQNLSQDAKFIAFYDVKNARLTDRKAGQEHTIVRGPLIDMIKFAAFCAIVHSLLKAGQGDVVWILAGKTDSNMQKIRKQITELGWKFKAIHLIYDWRNQQKWYFKKMRGMANSKTYEKALLCWKGKFPTGLPRDRQYVDVGTSLYVDTMLKVPVLHPKDLTYVAGSVFQDSLKTMCGITEETPQEDTEVVGAAIDEVAASAVQPRPQEHVRKRRIYRVAAEDSVSWFPHDNHPDLLKELAWESGNPRWILHGTPASGAGVLGCLDFGSSVIALCEDAHHLKHFEVAVQQRAIEAMLAGSRVFKDEALQARALDFCSGPMKQEKKTKKNKEQTNEDEGKQGTDDKKDKKDKEGKMTKKKKTKSDKESDDNDTESDDKSDCSSEKKEKKGKTTKKKKTKTDGAKHPKKKKAEGEPYSQKKKKKQKKSSDADTDAISASTDSS